MIAARILLVSTTLAFAGCASFSPQQSLAPASKSVEDRTGVSLNWPQSQDEEKESDVRVNELLKAKLGVKTAVQIAVLNNLTLRGTFQEIRISQADLLRASQLANPTLSASVRWPNQKPRGPDSEFSFAVDLLDGLLIPLKRNFAAVQVGQAQKRVAGEVMKLVTDVKMALYTLEAHQMLHDRLGGIVSVNESAADLASRQFEAGNINHLELLNQQVSAQESRLELIRSDAQIRSDREVVNRLLGLWGAQTNWSTEEMLPSVEMTALDDRTNYEAVALRQRLDLEIARSQVDLTRSSLGLKTSTRWLPVSVNVGVDTERESPGDRLTGPTLELTLPIFHQGRAEIALLLAEVRRAETAFAALAINIRSEVREARDRLMAAAAAVNYYQATLLPQRKAILRETLLHYNAMQKSSYELLAAKEQELSAERESIAALREYWIGRAEFERALGGRITQPSEGTHEPAGGRTPDK